jgi:hypothetical protein
MSATEWTVPDILQMSGGYWSSCALHTGVKLDIFSILDGIALTSLEVAELRSLNPRATGMLLDSLVAIGLLEKQGNVYAATPFSMTNLSKKSSGYLGHIIMHHHHLMSGWARLDEALTSGGPIREPVSHADDEKVRESFLMGMFNLANRLAPRVAQSVNLKNSRTLLDLGGGPGTYAIHFCIANPGLTAVVYDLPTTRSFAEGTISRFNLSERITFVSGNYHTEGVPSGFDAVWISHVLHSDGPGACVELLSKAVAAINVGGIVMVQEFILNDAKDGPLFPALFSLNMLLGTESGQSYSESELTAMMAEAGLHELHRLGIDLPNGTGVICGRKL